MFLALVGCHVYCADFVENYNRCMEEHGEEVETPEDYEVVSDRPWVDVGENWWRCKAEAYGDSFASDEGFEHARAEDDECEMAYGDG